MDVNRHSAASMQPDGSALLNCSSSSSNVVKVESGKGKWSGVVWEVCGKLSCVGVKEGKDR